MNRIDKKLRALKKKKKKALITFITAGDPSMGLMTVMAPSRASTSTPMPTKRPSVSFWNSVKSVGGR